MYDLKEVMGLFDVVPDVEDMKYRVIAYCYEAYDYEGDAYVLLERDGHYYEVQGAHCSCYGLEGQWELQHTTPEALKHRIDHGQHYGAFLDCIAKIQEHFKDRWVVDSKK